SHTAGAADRLRRNSHRETAHICEAPRRLRPAPTPASWLPAAWQRVACISWRVLFLQKERRLLQALRQRETRVLFGFAGSRRPSRRFQHRHHRELRRSRDEVKPLPTRSIVELVRLVEEDGRRRLK